MVNGDFHCLFVQRSESMADSSHIRFGQGYITGQRKNIVGFLNLNICQLS